MIGKIKKMLRPAVITAGKKNIHEMETIRSYIGRRVISKSGDYAGKVFDIAVDRGRVAAFLVRRGISMAWIGSEFVADSSRKSVMLSIDPATMLRGKVVFDSDGRRVGKVKMVVRKGLTNSIESIAVKRKFYSRAVRFKKSDIEVMKKNVILNRACE